MPLLTITAKACGQLLDPIGHMRANDTLGHALEANADKARACAAYKVVRQAWSKASPRSITAEDARARATALACAD